MKNFEKKFLKIYIALIMQIFFIWQLFAFNETTMGSMSKGRRCKNVDIRKIYDWILLENCTAVEGYLRVVMISMDEQQKRQFPLLLEITGYLLIYRVHGITSLSQLFPNLVLIRGQQLAQNYALIVYDLVQLKDIGLHSLRLIERGSVRIERNPLLCYTTTVDWSLILQQPLHHVEQKYEVNIDHVQKERFCVNLCPGKLIYERSKGKKIHQNDCPSSSGTYLGLMSNTKHLCWNSDHCQRICNSKCPYNCLNSNKDVCCHRECLTGCTLPNSAKHCLSCLHVFYLEECVTACPKDFVKYLNRRCIARHECTSLRSSGDAATSQKFYIFKDECVTTCPKGYKADNSIGECVQCVGKCPKACDGGFYYSVKNLMKLRGCNIVTSLVIDIASDSDSQNFMQDLTESLGDIEIIEQSLKIVRCKSFVSLAFFKSLREIQGYPNNDYGNIQLNVNRVTFEITDNSNLQDLWDWRKRSHQLSIHRGRVLFHMNRRLCYEKIKHFLLNGVVFGLPQSVASGGDYNREQNVTLNLERDASPLTNGDMAVCNVIKFRLSINKIHARFAVLQYWPYLPSDRRTLLGYLVLHKPVGAKNMTLREDKNVCSDLDWTTVMTDCSSSTVLNERLSCKHVINGLQPATNYALYMQAVTTTLMREDVMTDIVYFTTASTHPSAPHNLKVVPLSSSELFVNWEAPKNSNGHVTHYRIWLRKVLFKKEEFSKRDYCEYKLSELPSNIRNANSIKQSVKSGVKSMISENEDPKFKSVQILCSKKMEMCKCSPKFNSQSSASRMSEIKFEDSLQNIVFKKSISDLWENFNYFMPSKLKTKKRLGFGNSESTTNVSEFNHTPFVALNKIDVILNKSAEFLSPVVSTAVGTDEIVFYDEPLDADVYENQTSARLFSKDEKFNVNISLMNLTEEQYFEVYDRTNIVITDLDYFTEYEVKVMACHDAFKDKKVDNQVVYRQFCSTKSVGNGLTDALDHADDINASLVNFQLAKTGDLVAVHIIWWAPPHPNGLVLNYLLKYRRLGDTMSWHEPCISYLQWRNMGRDDEEDEKVRSTTQSFLNSDIAAANDVFSLHSSDDSAKFHMASERLGGTVIRDLRVGEYEFMIRAVTLASNGTWTSIIRFTVAPQYSQQFLSIGAACVVIILLIFILIALSAWRKQKSARLTVISTNPEYDPMEPDEWEIPREDVEVDKQQLLGQGNFGLVYRGRIKDLKTPARDYVCITTTSEQNSMPCAIKFIREDGTLRDRYEFLREACHMKFFRECFHIVKLLGVVTLHMPTMVVMELMEKGDLKKYLLSMRSDTTTISLLPDKQLLAWAAQVADGMAYLVDQKFVHRDLATRNIMVHSSEVVKIADFGMSRDIYRTDYYLQGGRGMMPVRWMSPESLSDGLNTSASDVWSYGVVLWEMVTLAANPYCTLNNIEVMNYIKNGGTLEKPTDCSDRLWQLMHQCWQFKACFRPSFLDILYQLKDDVCEAFRACSYHYSVRLPHKLAMEDNTSEFITDHSQSSSTMEHNSFSNYSPRSSTVDDKAELHLASSLLMLANISTSEKHHSEKFSFLNPTKTTSKNGWYLTDEKSISPSTLDFAQSNVFSVVSNDGCDHETAEHSLLHPSQTHLSNLIEDIQPSLV